MSAADMASPRGAAALQPRVSGLTHVTFAAMALAASGGLVCALGLWAAGVPVQAFEIAMCAGPVLVTAGLGTTSQSDRDQYTARVLVAALMLPILLVFWATSQDMTVSQGAMIAAVFGFIVLHGLGFAALIYLLASTTTRIEAAPGTSFVDAATLGARLQLLLSADVPWKLSRNSGMHGDTHEWCIDSDLPNDEKRFHRVLLNIDQAKREVQVRERLGASGAAPKDADEASMRSLGDEAFDSARPEAQKVWSRTFQTTMIKPEQLAQVRLHLMGSHAQAEASVLAETADSKMLLTLLAALVTRSGYAWQPVMAKRP